MVGSWEAVIFFAGNHSNKAFLCVKVCGVQDPWSKGSFLRWSYFVQPINYSGASNWSFCFRLFPPSLWILATTMFVGPLRFLSSTCIDQERKSNWLGLSGTSLSTSTCCSPMDRRAWSPSKCCPGNSLGARVAGAGEGGPGVTLRWKAARLLLIHWGFVGGGRANSSLGLRDCWLHLLGTQIPPWVWMGLESFSTVKSNGIQEYWYLREIAHGQ